MSNKVTHRTIFKHFDHTGKVVIHKTNSEGIENLIEDFVYFLKAASYADSTIRNGLNSVASELEQESENE